MMPRFGGYVQSRKAVEQLGDKLRLSPVGSGPFEFVGYEPKQKVVTRAFDQHWGGKPKVDRLEVLFLTETAARTLAFVKGAGRWLFRMPSSGQASWTPNTG